MKTELGENKKTWIVYSLFAIMIAAAVAVVWFYAVYIPGMEP